MKNFTILSTVSAFLGGVAFALMLSYPIDQNSLYVCAWAIFICLVAVILAAWAIALVVARDASERTQIRVDHLVDRVIARVLDDRRLRSVDD